MESMRIRTARARTVKGSAKGLAATIAIFLGAASALAAGDSCDRPIDLRKPGFTVGDHPVVSQGYGDTNTCGFFASSWLLDAYRKKHGIGVGPDGKLAGLVQPIGLGVDLAIQRNMPIWFPIQNTTDPLSTQGGRWGSLACSVLRYARDYGACVDGSTLTSDLDSSAKLSDKTTMLYAKLLEYARLSKGDRAAGLDRYAATIYNLYLGTEPKPAAVDALSYDRVRGLLQANERDPYKTIRGLFFSRCKDQRVDLADLPACRSKLYLGWDMFGINIRKRPARVRKIQDRVDGLLSERDALPVAFAYCSKLLRGGKSAVGMSPLASGCGLHWSLIIGKKKIGGKCSYLVRNSADPEKPYAKDWIRDGYDVWIDADDLAKSIYMLSWLDDDSSGGRSLASDDDGEVFSE